MYRDILRIKIEFVLYFMNFFFRSINHYFQNDAQQYHLLQGGEYKNHHFFFISFFRRDCFTNILNTGETVKKKLFTRKTQSKVNS
jgi:hypothetical protein